MYTFDHRMVLDHLAEMHYDARNTRNRAEVHAKLDEASDLVHQSHLAHLSGDGDKAAELMRSALYPLSLAAKSFTGKLGKKTNFEARHFTIKQMANNYAKPHWTEDTPIKFDFDPQTLNNQSKGSQSEGAKRQLNKAQEAIDSVADESNLLLPGDYRNLGGSKAPNGE